MKYISAMYAKAFATAAKASASVDKTMLVNNFVSLLKRTGDIRYGDRIMQAVEALWVQREGGRSVRLETAQPMNERLRKAVHAKFTNKDVIRETINPALIAGIRIVVNGERELDGSMRRKVQKLFRSI